MSFDDPTTDRGALRAKLLAARLSLPDRDERTVALQEALRVWLLGREETRIGGYWPIKGEFDPLPALYRWSEGAPGRRIGLPVSDRGSGSLSFRVWFPGCPMEPDHHDIPKPKGTAVFEPQMLLLPCMGYGPGGVRFGYGGGFYARTVAAMVPRLFTVGLCYSNGFLPFLRAVEGEAPLDALVTDDGVVWQRNDNA